MVPMGLLGSTEGRSGDASTTAAGGGQTEAVPHLVRGHELPEVFTPNTARVVLLELFEQPGIGGEHPLDLVVDHGPPSRRIGRDRTRRCPRPIVTTAPPRSSTATVSR